MPSLTTKTNPKISKVLVQQPTSALMKAPRKMINILFWNLQGNDLSNEVLLLANEHDVDMMIFAETTIPTRTALNNLLSTKGYVSRTPIKGRVRIAIFDNFINSNTKMLDLVQSSLYTCVCYEISGEKVIISGVHLDSKASAPDVDQLVLAGECAAPLHAFEIKNQTDKMIAIGDFNMNPFDLGMISYRGMHSTYCKRTAMNLTHPRSNYPYFFNPSWVAYGNDSTIGMPPGTHYYEPRKAKDSYILYWNMLDQVLIRPSLLERISAQSFTVLTSFKNGRKTIALLDTNGRPDEKYSDHLPIRFNFEI